ncbi:MAG: CYTH domain-containing protein [bacterium]|nr:CYTH domain-containing protein [bacterium]
MNIEVELRTFLTAEKYKELLELFQKNASFIATEKQETHYLNTNEDLRIQKNDFFAKVWLKKGKLHDEAREEIEIHFQKEDFPKIEKIFTIIGLTPKIKWYRTRTTFAWEGISVMIDDTKGYGYILELEKMSTEENKEKDILFLKEKLEQLNIPLSNKEEFEQKFKDYEQNWEALTK